MKRRINKSPLDMQCRYIVLGLLTFLTIVFYFQPHAVGTEKVPLSVSTPRGKSVIHDKAGTTHVLSSVHSDSLDLELDLGWVSVNIFNVAEVTGTGSGTHLVTLTNGDRLEGRAYGTLTGTSALGDISIFWNDVARASFQWDKKEPGPVLAAGWSASVQSNIALLKRIQVLHIRRTYRIGYRYGNPVYSSDELDYIPVGDGRNENWDSQRDIPLGRVRSIRLAEQRGETRVEYLRRDGSAAEATGQIECPRTNRDAETYIEATNAVGKWTIKTRHAQAITIVFDKPQAQATTKEKVAIRYRGSCQPWSGPTMDLIGGTPEQVSITVGAARQSVGWDRIRELRFLEGSSNREQGFYDAEILLDGGVLLKGNAWNAFGDIICRDGDGILVHFASPSIKSVSITERLQ